MVTQTDVSNADANLLAGICDSMPGRGMHTEACRTRLQNVMMEDEKGKSTLEQHDKRMRQRK